MSDIPGAADRYSKPVSTRLTSTDVDRQRIPVPLIRGFYIAVVGLAVLGLPYLGRSYGPVSATIVLDAWIVLFIVTCFVRGRTQTYGTMLLLLAYLLSRIVPAMATGAPVEDFLQAYRWVLYLLAFALAAGRIWSPTTGLIRVTWLLAAAATAKAVVTLVLVGSGERPGLLLENNFELALFVGLTVALYRFMGDRRGWLVVLLGVLTLLSGSRSGAITFALLAIYALLNWRRASKTSRYLLAFAAVPVIAALPIAVFTERAAGSIYQIDRLNFLSVFLAETSTWSPIEWVFGTTPITPLSGTACHALAYYESLFSSTGDGSCYAVILHAFLMRVVYDAGLVGLAIAILVPIVIMRRLHVPGLVALGLTAVALVNGASVSGLNNPYVAFPFLIVILTAGVQKWEDRLSHEEVPGTSEAAASRDSPSPLVAKA